MILFTAVFGKPDVLFDPVVLPPDVEAVCWTDMDFVGQTAWRMSKICLDGLSPVKRNRKVKIWFPPIFDGYRYSLYIDSTVRLLVDPRELIRFLEPGSGIAMFRAFDRDCLYEEARLVVKYKGVDPDVMRRQVARYRGEGIKPHSGLWAGTMILRRHTDLMREFCQDWWAEVEAFSHRDQISFPYVVAKRGIKVSELPGTVFCKDFAQWMPWARKDQGYKSNWEPRNSGKKPT
jgi:hypothetical protein